MERLPWEQREDESDAAYARFLVYRNLGPARSLDAAYALVATKRVKSRGSPKIDTARRASGQWVQDSAAFDWAARATAWDVQVLTEVGRRAVVNFIHALELVSLKTLNELLNPKRRPANWHQLMEAVNLLGSFIPAETVAALQSDAAEHRTPAIGATPDTERAPV